MSIQYYVNVRELPNDVYQKRLLNPSGTSLYYRSDVIVDNMPLSTFHNLSLARQEKILAAALAEFAAYDFQQASINRIVAALGISKGGFYRYFASKVDLYAYVLEHATQKRLQTVQHLFAGADDFFALMRDNFYHRLRFDLEHPVYARFLQNNMQERHSPALGNLYQQTLERIVGLVESLLERFQAAGKIRTDLNLRLMAYTVVQVQMGMLDFLQLQGETDPEQTAQTMATVEQFIAVLRTGLQPATS